MTFDPRKLELTWDCDEDPTYVECVMLHPDKGPISLKVGRVRGARLGTGRGGRRENAPSSGPTPSGGRGGVPEKYAKLP